MVKALLSPKNNPAGIPVSSNLGFMQSRHQKGTFGQTVLLSDP